jgi:hypothetical protein
MFGFVGATDFEVGELITPVADLTALDNPPWHWKVGGVGGSQQIAVAAQFATVGLSIPMVGPSESLVAVCRYLIATTSDVLPVQCRIASVNGLVAPAGGYASSAASVGTWDSLIVRSATDVIRPQAQISIATQAAVDLNNSNSLAAIATPRGAAVSLAIIPGPWVVRPGASLMVQNAVANKELTVGFYWDEYYLA